MGILRWIAGKGIVYYPGCLTRFALPEQLENYKRILDLLGIDFIMNKEDRCCGSPVLNAGYEKDARELVIKTFEELKKKGIGKIIVNCPACFKTFNQEYKKLVREWNIPAEHITVSVLNRLKQKPGIIRNKAEDEKIIYHDPCHLGRYSNVYEEPREVLKMLGYKVVELPLNHENSLCCGGGGGLKANNPKLANQVALKILGYAKKQGANKIVSTCPMCFSQFKENFDIEVLEFSDIVLSSLKKR